MSEDIAKLSPPSTASKAAPPCPEQSYPNKQLSWRKQTLIAVGDNLHDKSGPVLRNSVEKLREWAVMFISSSHSADDVFGLAQYSLIRLLEGYLWLKDYSMAYSLGHVMLGEVSTDVNILKALKVPGECPGFKVKLDKVLAGIASALAKKNAMGSFDKMRYSRAKMLANLGEAAAGLKDCSKAHKYYTACLSEVPPGEEYQEDLSFQLSGKVYTGYKARAYISKLACELEAEVSSAEALMRAEKWPDLLSGLSSKVQYLQKKYEEIRDLNIINDSGLTQQKDELIARKAKDDGRLLACLIWAYYNTGKPPEGSKTPRNSANLREAAFLLKLLLPASIKSGYESEVANFSQTTISDPNLKGLLSAKPKEDKENALPELIALLGPLGKTDEELKLEEKVLSKNPGAFAMNRENTGRFARVLIGSYYDLVKKSNDPKVKTKYHTRIAVLAWQMLPDKPAQLATELENNPEWKALAGEVVKDGFDLRRINGLGSGAKKKNILGIAGSLQYLKKGALAGLMYRSIEKEAYDNALVIPSAQNLIDLATVYYEIGFSAGQDDEKGKQYLAQARDLYGFLSQGKIPSPSADASFNALVSKLGSLAITDSDKIKAAKSYAGLLKLTGSYRVALAMFEELEEYYKDKPKPEHYYNEVVFGKAECQVWLKQYEAAVLTCDSVLSNPALLNIMLEFPKDILSGINIRAWAYSARAEQIKKNSVRKKEAAGDYLKAAGTVASLIGGIENNLPEVAWIQPNIASALDADIAVLRIDYANYLLSASELIDDPEKARALREQAKQAIVIIHSSSSVRNGDLVFARTYLLEALSLKREGKFNEAETKFKDALAFAEKAASSASSAGEKKAAGFKLREVIGAFGGYYDDLGQGAKALEMFEKGIALYKKELDSDHTVTDEKEIVSLRQDLADFYRAAAKWQAGPQKKREQLDAALKIYSDAKLANNPRALSGQAQTYAALADGLKKGEITRHSDEASYRGAAEKALQDSLKLARQAIVSAQIDPDEAVQIVRKAKEVMVGSLASLAYLDEDNPNIDLADQALELQAGLLALDPTSAKELEIYLNLHEARVSGRLKTAKDQAGKQAVMDDFINSMESLPLAGDAKFLARLNHIFARLYMWELQDYPKAREYNDKVLAQEPVLTADAPGFEIVVKSKLIEAQLFDKEKNYAQAEAALLEMEKMLQGKNMPDLLIEAYQNLGDLYNWRLKDMEKARDYYQLAIGLLPQIKEGLEKNNKALDLEINMGDTYRKFDCGMQLHHYDEAQKKLSLVTDEKTLKFYQVKLKLRYAEAYADLKRPEAYIFWNDAQKLISASALSDLELKEFDETLLGLRDTLAGALKNQAKVSWGYQDESFNGVPTAETFVKVDAEFEILTWLRLAGSISFSDVSQGYKVSEKSVFDRLSTGSWDNFSISVDPRMTYQKGVWTIKGGPGFAVSKTGYSVSQYDWEEYGKTCVGDAGCENREEKQAVLVTTLTRAAIEAAWKFAEGKAGGDWSLYARPIFEWLYKDADPSSEANSAAANERIAGLQRWYNKDMAAAIREGKTTDEFEILDDGRDRSTREPLGIAGNGIDDRQDEIEKIKKEIEKNDYRENLFKAGAELGARFYSLVSLGNGCRLGISAHGGFKGEYDEIGATRYGFWLIPEETWAMVKLAGTLGAGLELSHKGGFFMKLDLSGEIGNYQNAGGTFEIGYKHPKVQVSGGVKGNYYHQTYEDDNRDQKVESGSVTGFIEIKF